MNLYLSKGRIWTGTQADAKEAQGGKDFEHIDFPTDKPGLLAVLNDMPNRFPGMFGERMASSAPVEVAPDEDDDQVMADPEMKGEVRTATPAPVAPGSCVACNRTARVAKIVANSSAALTIKADLSDITDMASLDAILDAVNDRKKALFMQDEEAA